MKEENAMEKFGCAAAVTDSERIANAVNKLPPEYTRKVMIFAETLLDIFQRKSERRCMS